MFSKNKEIDEKETESNLQKGDIHYRRNEFQMLAKSIYNKIANSPQDNKVFYTVIAGDYNLCLYEQPTLMHNEIKLENMTLVTVQHKKTSLKTPPSAENNPKKLQEFKEKINDNFFIEYVCYNGNYYGTSRSDLADNKVVILEPTGLKHYLAEARDLIKVVFLKCSQEVLRIRMKNRGDKEEDINKRLLSDKDVFSSEVSKLADLVLDTTASNIYVDTATIYKFYQRSR